MAETAFSFSQIESHTADQSVPEGHHEVRGWVWPKLGQLICDVRVRSAGKVWPAMHGFPRADLAAHFRTGRPVALAEFRAVVALAPGDAALTFEALTIAGEWRAFQTLSLRVLASPTPAQRAMPTGPLRWHEYGRALQLVLREQSLRPDAPPEKVFEEFIASLPHPRDLQQPPPPFRGHLDEPAALAPCRFGRIPVLGYLLHEQQAIRRVLATIDQQCWQTISHGHPSPGPASYFPHLPAAAHCGLVGFVDAPAQLPSPLALRVYAELEDGSVHLVMVQRAHVFTREQEKTPWPNQTDHPFQLAHRRLLGALERAGVAIEQDAAFHAEVRRVEEDFLAHAPLAARGTPALLPAPERATKPAPRRVLLVSHNLGLEGAPLFLVDLARTLLASGSEVTVASPTGGPLRESLESLGVRVRVIDAAGVFHACSATEARGAIEALAPQFAGFDLVVGNTFTTFWAVHAARAANVPMLLYVHESTTPAAFYGEQLHPEVITLVEEAFASATAVSFTTAATRQYHVHYGRPERHRLCRGWVDVTAIDAWRRQHSREQLRARFGLQPDELLVTNVGTVSDRKGQHIFARAVDLLWRRDPGLAARTRFVMLGGGASLFDQLLVDLLAQLDRPNLEIHPANADYLAYYAAADVMVCSSYEESTPRVILEAMACGTAIVSTAVHGIPELVEHDREAALVAPGNTAELCATLQRLLGSPALRASLGERAAVRVREQHDATVVLPRHLALLTEVAATARSA